MATTILGQNYINFHLQNNWNYLGGKYSKNKRDEVSWNNHSRIEAIIEEFSPFLEGR